MSFEDIYSCNNCDFEIAQETELFFYNSDSKETIDYVLIMSTAGMGEGHETKGHVYRSYCKCCDKFVKVYVIYDGGGGDMAQQVYRGIKNNVGKYEDKIKQLKEIKKREKYSLEKIDGFYLINFYELDSCGFMKPIDSQHGEDAVVENAINEFHKIIDSQIDSVKNFYQKESKLINIVVDDSEGSSGDFVNCPECGNKIDKYVNEDTPCPKCGGKLTCTDTIIWD